VELAELGLEFHYYYYRAAGEPASRAAPRRGEGGPRGAGGPGRAERGEGVCRVYLVDCADFF